MEFLESILEGAFVVASVVGGVFIVVDALIDRGEF